MHIILEINLSKKHIKMGLWGMGLLLLLLILRPLVSVPIGHAGVVVELGEVQEQVLPAGLHFKLPSFQKVVNMDCRMQKMEIHTLASSRDLQALSSKLSINYHIDPSSAAEIYQRVGMEYEYILIEPVVQEAFSEVSASYNASDLIRNSPQIALETQRLVATKLAQYDINVDRLSITDLNFNYRANPVRLL